MKNKKRTLTTLFLFFTPLELDPYYVLFTYVATALFFQFANLGGVDFVYDCDMWLGLLLYV